MVAAILRADVAGLAHAADDQAAVGVQDQLDGAGKITVQALLQGFDGSRFDAQGLATQFQSAFRGKAMSVGTWVHGRAAVKMYKVYLNRENDL